MASSLRRLAEAEPVTSVDGSVVIGGPVLARLSLSLSAVPDRPVTLPRDRHQYAARLRGKGGGGVALRGRRAERRSFPGSPPERSRRLTDAGNGGRGPPAAREVANQRAAVRRAGPGRAEVHAAARGMAGRGSGGALHSHLFRIRRSQG